MTKDIIDWSVLFLDIIRQVIQQRRAESANVIAHLSGGWIQISIPPDDVQLVGL
jgi:hypothetical protein